MLNVEQNINAVDIFFIFYKKLQKVWAILPLLIFLFAGMLRASDIGLSVKQADHQVNILDQSTPKLKFQKLSHIYSTQGTLHTKYNNFDVAILDSANTEPFKAVSRWNADHPGRHISSLGSDAAKELRAEQALEKAQKRRRRQKKVKPKVDKKTKEVQKESAVRFQVWKTMQVINVQNKLSRLNNDLLRSRLNEDPQEVSLLENKILVEKIKLKQAKSLSFEHYLAVSLEEIGDDPRQLLDFASKLSDKEIVDILRQLKKRSKFKDLVSNY
ncbi:MAG: hypothetical protein HOO06_13535 [Bdellovibrionaceae bacterium]|nr:hypothetical protein [Pseudobdellovibrionaceae bacterium]